MSWALVICFSSCYFSLTCSHSFSSWLKFVNGFQFDLKLWSEACASAGSFRDRLTAGCPISSLGACSVTQFFCNSMGGSMPASSVHGVLQATPWWLGCHFLLWGIFLTQGWNLHLLHLLYWQANSLPLSQPRKPPFPTWHSFYIPPVKSWDKITFLFALVSVFKELLGTYRCIVLKLHASYTKVFSARQRADH